MRPRWALVVAFLLAGCATTIPTPPRIPAEPPASNPAVPVGPAGLYPADFRTHQPELDAVIDAFMARDVERLMGMVAMTSGKCAGGTAFYCGDMPEGTVRSYFARATCQVTYLVDKQMIREDMQRWVEEPRYLYAAYSVQGMEPNAYYLIFADGLDDHSAKNVYLNADGQITQLGLGCNVPTTPLSADHFKPIAPPRSL